MELTIDINRDGPVFFFLTPSNSTRRYKHVHSRFHLPLFLSPNRLNNVSLSRRSFSCCPCSLCPRDRFCPYLTILSMILDSQPSKVTNPVASTSLPAGQQATVAWQDDGTSPTLASFGPASIGLYAGNAQQQVCTVHLVFVVLRLMNFRLSYN
jgi:hypothetical protein